MHVLELLLHEVLEAETSASHAAKTLAREDALLPHVVEFLGHFPGMLGVVVHCARKTEIAKWPYLFACVGAPKDLFARCLETRELSTAASFVFFC
jgi:hypothetical protein